jgi:hypothetical protein
VRGTGAAALAGIVLVEGAGGVVLGAAFAVAAFVVLARVLRALSRGRRPLGSSSTEAQAPRLDRSCVARLGGASRHVKALIVLAQPPHPQGGAAGRCAWALLKGLHAHGVDVQANRGATSVGGCTAAGDPGPHRCCGCGVARVVTS